MSKKQKKDLIKITVSASLTILSLFLPWKFISIGVFIAAYLAAGYDVLIKAIRNIFTGRLFDENFLMGVATIGAFCIGEYVEGILVMILYQIGELFQSYSVDKSRESISALASMQPQSAHLVCDGKISDILPEKVSVGDVIAVYPGERIPVDGTVLKGKTEIDTSALTGESNPVYIEEGSSALSGCINMSGVIEMRAERLSSESAAARILEIVENSAMKKSKSENFISKFAKIYTPVVVISALLLAAIPSFITGDAAKWVERALTFLVVSCPCALVISVPLTFFAGIGKASKNGILIKGACYMDSMSKIKTVVFDKTGTLTNGYFSVTEAIPEGISRDELTYFAAGAETFSHHPVGEALKRYAEKENIRLDKARVSNAREIPGRGVVTEVDGNVVAVGSIGHMKDLSVELSCFDSEDEGTIMYAAVNGKYRGKILLSDAPKDTAIEAINMLRLEGAEKLVMLTGDRKSISEKTADKLKLDEVRAELLPEDKVSAVEELMAIGGDTKLAFVGDGINDAPVITRADVGFAMGAIGSDAAVEAADVVLMNDDPRLCPKAIRISKNTIRIVRQNIVFALAVKAAVLIGGALGLTGMWAAVFADVGVCVLAVFNAMRAGKS